MSKIAIVDPFAGIAGDMLVGALLDAGAPLEGVRKALATLGLTGFSISCDKVMRCGVTASKYRVEHNEGHHHRGLATILEILDGADLPERARARAKDAFCRLGEAEASIHGVTTDEVHFHEVGAIDAICDVVGAAVALELLEIETLHCRPLPLFRGSVDAAHGRIPLPAPATLELMKGLPVHDTDIEAELVTPTGAACVAAWADFGPARPHVPHAVGYGAGDRDPKGYPNVCRITVGE